MSGGGRGGRRLLGQILRDLGVVREGDVQRALEAQRAQGGPLGAHLVALGACTPADVTRALGVQAGLEVADLEREPSEPEALACVDADSARAYGLLPLALQDGVLRVALADPLNRAVVEDLAFATGLEVRAALADPALLARRVREAYGEAGGLADAIAAARGAGGEDVADAAKSAPIVRLLNAILARAVRDRASDVHFEAFPGELRVRFRVDGALYEIEAPPAHLAPALVARLKVMSDLDIAETKLPQDGRISLAIDGRAVDLRVATLPQVGGESCVLRVLDRTSVGLDLVALGLGEEDVATLSALCELPHGIVLVTGPTGSGKTTTLYAMLARVNHAQVKVITVEDPVEYDIDGLVQIPIQEEIGVTYPRVLRTVLRQDPDTILVGEIRDRETAQVAAEASLTGHTVFATVHTNDAPSAVTRLVDLGLEPYLVTATLEAVVAQRLVRTICSDCRREAEPDPEVLRELGPEAELLRGARVAHGAGCDRCFHTGYRGRTAICEVMHVDDGIRRLIREGASSGALREAARARGMRTLRESGLAAVRLGRTTVEEVLRETMGAA